MYGVLLLVVFVRDVVIVPVCVCVCVSLLCGRTSAWAIGLRLLMYCGAQVQLLL